MNVLFACVHNAGRSQMAEALFRLLAGGAHEARSAGSVPAEHIHPEVVGAMRELGVDLSERTPHRLERTDAEWAEVVARQLERTEVTVWETEEQKVWVPETAGW